MILLLSLIGCGKETAPTTSEVQTSYQKLSYNDFNNLAMEKGYSPVENADNSAIKFKRSFYIDDAGFNLFYFEFENTTSACEYYNYVAQTYQTFSSEFSSTVQYKDYACYFMKDGDYTLYVAFVENTLLYSLCVGDGKEHATHIRDALVNTIKYMQYPIPALPNFEE